MSNKQYEERKRSLATLMLIANITVKLGTELTRNVNQFRRKLRNNINAIERNENSLYKEAYALADRAWDKGFNQRQEQVNNLSVVMTLIHLNMLIQDTKWISKKVYTQRQFELVCQNITDDRDTEITLETEKASKEFINTIAEALGFDLPSNDKLKRMILIMKQNKEL